jgi:hypothetical protein
MSATQRGRILNLLRSANGAWVPLPEIMRCAAQYNTRILELRRSGLTIENRTEEINGVKHSWYRLIKSKAPPPSEDWYTRQTNRERPKEAQASPGPLFAGGSDR